MPVILLAVLLFFSCSRPFSAGALSLPVWDRPEAFSEYEKKKKQFENKRQKVLKRHMQKRKMEEIVMDLRRQRGRQQYERGEKQFERDRKRAFFSYKRDYARKQERRESILERRLKELKSMRREIRQQDFDF